MERWQLIVIVVVASSAWYLYKRFVKKERPWREGYRPPQPEVENWYSQTMATIDDMDESARAEKEAAWNTMPEKDRLEFSEKFLRDEFGQQAVMGYNRKQRLQIGLARFTQGGPEGQPEDRQDDSAAPTE
ncbi:MAG: hypothetical protein JW852_05125 [Spirochaetales bacterium]|nr:hypothetical protein [Spirochaetales bacterium]